MSKPAGWLYRHEKPIPTLSEDSLNPRFTTRLVNHGWRYAPKRHHGLDQSAGGHWVPPGYRKPGYEQAETTLTKGSMKNRRLITNSAIKRTKSKQGRPFGPRPQTIAPPGGVGKQLAGRVASGGVTQKQAAQTARERQTLKAAYGSDWRTKVFGMGGAKGISGPFASRTVAAKRDRALAKAKLKKPAKGRRVKGGSYLERMNG